MLKYISISAILFCTSLNFSAAQTSNSALTTIALEKPTIDIVQNLSTMSYLAEKHSPNKTMHSYNTLTKVMKGKTVKSIFNMHMQQIAYQLSFLNYDYKIVDKNTFIENIKNRLIAHPNAKQFGEIITLMIAQLETSFATLANDKEVSLKDICDVLNLQMDKEIAVGSFTGDYFWNFLNTAYNPFEHLKIIIEKEKKNIESLQKVATETINYNNFYWDITNIYNESKGKYISPNFFLTYIQDKMNTAQYEAEKDLYIIATQEIVRSFKNEYYIPEFYLEKMQSSIHTFIQKDRFINKMNLLPNKNLLNTWLENIEKGFSLALLPLHLIQEDFTVYIKNNTLNQTISINGKSKTFIKNSAVKAHTDNISIANNTITINNKDYSVELINYTGAESASNNRRSLLIYPKGNTDKTPFIQVNIFFSMEHSKIESYRMLVDIVNIDMTKNLAAIDKDLFNFSQDLKIILNK